MKKKYMILAAVLVTIIAVFCTLYAINNRSNNNEPSTGITDRTAIEIAQKTFDEKSKETVTNFDNPKVEEVVFDSPHYMAYFADKVNIVGKPLYKITFNTTQDGLLGPIVIYVDKSSGKLIGMDYRM